MKQTDHIEKKQHGSTDFSLQYYPCNVNYPITTMPLHRHKECELIRVLSGEFHVFLDNVEHCGQEGDCFLLPAGVLHRAEPQHASYDCVVFNPEMLYGRGNGRVAELLLPFLSGLVEPTLLSQADFPVFCRTAQELFSLFAKPSAYHELAVCGKLSELFFRFYEANPAALTEKHSKNQHQNRWIRVLLQWMEEHYAQKITLADLAAVANVNERYLCRAFREFTGRTPMDYLNELRVDRACYEMTVKRRNVTEAAYETGFGDPSYFSKVFRKYRSLSPLEYKKQKISDEGNPTTIDSRGDLCYND